MVNGLRGYLLTSEKYFIDTYDSAVNENSKILDELLVTIPDSGQIKLLKEIILLNDKWVEEYAEPLRQAKSVANVNDSNLIAFNKLYKARSSNGNKKGIQEILQQKFRDLTNTEYEIREKRSMKLVSTVNKTRQISLALTILSIVAAFLVVNFLVKRISARISKMVKIANSIASGNYGVTLKDTGRDELSALSYSLNHMSQELSKNIALLKSKNEELDQFAHIVSHDLKGPLRGIDNVVTWIEEDHTAELTPKVSEYLGIIKNRVNRTQNLIDGILSYARTDKESRKREMVDVNALVQEILQSLPPSPAIQVDVYDLPSFHTERIPLLQVFSNLISNAIKYNDKNPAIIKVYHKEHLLFYEFFVEDNGPGIADIYHKKIFVIFQTLKERDSFESNGVGLAIVKKILNARKEKIELTSQVGKGSVFSFTWTK
jgi:signal transduction histidine kinase